MLKRWTSKTILVIVIFLSITVEVSAEPKQPIAVYFDGVRMAFDAEPYIENGSTMVPFQAIFDKLGLAIEWDAASQRVTGTKQGLAIELRIGRKSAVVNGVTQTLPFAPVLKNGRTFVPLRFVTEHSGKEVSWDGRARVIYIADAERQIRHLFDKYYAYMNEQDLPGMLSVIDPSSPLHAQTNAQWSEWFAAGHDLRAEATYRVLERNDGQASVEVRQRMAGLSEADSDYEDHDSVWLHRLVRSDGAWRIYASQPLYVKYRQFPSAEEGPVALNEADRLAVLGVLEQSRANTQREDAEAERALYMPEFPGLERKLEQAKQVMDAFDFECMLGPVSFLAGAGDQAQVRYTVFLKRLSGPPLPDAVSEYAATLRKDADGKWKFASLETLRVDYRVETIVQFLADHEAAAR